MELLKDQKEAWERFVSTGDMDALSRVYFHFYDHLFDYGVRLTSDKDAVEDAIQNQFMNLIRQQQHLSQIENLPGYLIVSFRRQLLADLKKQKRLDNSTPLPDYPFEFFNDADGEFQDQNSKELLFRTIKDCISNLSSRQQEILHLRFVKEIPYETISEILNITIDSCYKSIYRCINILRAEVEKVRKEKIYLILLLFANSSSF
jgi:RNA polymerase sigma factor (sigma-70 family)